ncbi:integumentary mucin A.1-like [Colias croceus]|uniref:integumentary mucin A.1-like n=1 Tax=Colias crocea TaxID=72248 RepID=UPI001E281123|nr:integumentary mucin A.1-like [Colias croceus]
MSSTVIITLLIIKSLHASWPNPENDTLIYIANPVEADLPGHWMPLSVMKIILGGTTKTTAKKLKQTLATTVPMTRPTVKITTVKRFEALTEPVTSTTETLPPPKETDPPLTTEATIAATTEAITEATTEVTTETTTVAPPPPASEEPPPPPPPITTPTSTTTEATTTTTEATTTKTTTTTTVPPPTTKKGPPRKPKPATDGHENLPS